ncbi:MAG: precorrin-6B methylase [Eubacteriales bacterium]|nr:precorrin-6B methylase [Eubacteriales bacterium]
MEKHINTSIYTNDRILAWLKYFSEKAGLNLERVKIIDTTEKKKNVIPSVEANRRVLIFVGPDNQNLFYDMWMAGLGECEAWFKPGLDPVGDIQPAKVRECINLEIQEPTAILIINNNAHSNRIGMKNDHFSRGSVRYVGNEIRAVIVSKLDITEQDTICIISGESIAVEAAMIASEGTIITVEYGRHDRQSMEDNVQKFGLHNVEIIDNCEPETLIQLPVPDQAFIVATDRLEQEIENLLKVNPKMRFTIYTLEMNLLCKIPAIFEKFGIENMEIIQIALSKLNSKNIFEAQPAPWIISGEIV